MAVQPGIAAVTDRVRRRSAPTRAAYLARLDQARAAGVQRSTLGCTNLAHAWAAAPAPDRIMLREQRRPNLAIVSAYNDMLSAHQPLERYPDILKRAAREAGATAQFAGGVPAMCDGVTQGEPGMELSLFSRDVIAQATAIALAHNMFDGALYLGVCDKIVPGLLIGALHFGHLPAVFVPAGPMPSGLSNPAKAAVRQRHARGEAGRAELLAAEEAAYHAPGTCTFYGTANSNQMLMEVMGLHLPGTAFVAPGTPLRAALTAESARRAAAITALGSQYLPVGRVVDEKAIVNAMVALLATGGSTNHTIHLPAIARSAGIVIDWDDFHALSAQVPLVARVYPNGQADVNQFHAAGGMAFVISELLAAGLLHEDVTTLCGPGLAPYATVPRLEGDALRWDAPPAGSGDDTILRPAAAPFASDGGVKLLRGNLGRAVIKTAAVQADHRVVQAPARVFDSQDAVIAAFKAGALQGDFVAVVRYQGPRANGMPELHRLTPVLGVLQDQGLRVALVTDGRMSGASGKVPAAIHVTPECLAGGPLARVRDGDMMLVDAEQGRLEALVDADEWAQRTDVRLAAPPHGMGRELFAAMRSTVRSAEEGAVTFAPVDAHADAAASADGTHPGERVDLAVAPR